MGVLLTVLLLLAAAALTAVAVSLTAQVPALPLGR